MTVTLANALLALPDDDPFIERVAERAAQIMEERLTNRMRDALRRALEQSDSFVAKEIY